MWTIVQMESGGICGMMVVVSYPFVSIGLSTLSFVPGKLEHQNSPRTMMLNHNLSQCC